MTTIHHLNCGWLQVPGPKKTMAACHCLLLEDKSGLALVDTGIGLLDVRFPKERIGPELINMAGFRFEEADTAVRQIERLGHRPADVLQIILTHGDPDHAGGLADFPNARVYTASEERAAIIAGDWRYRPAQFAHGVSWAAPPQSSTSWYGIDSLQLPIGFESEVLLVPLFGHTLGHCGVAIQRGNRWLLHVGDAYCLRIELATDDHPVSILTAQRAVNDVQRRASLEHLRRLSRDHPDEIGMVGYHDPAELPR